MFWGRETVFLLLRLEPRSLGCPACNLLTVLTEVSPFYVCLSLFLLVFKDEAELYLKIQFVPRSKHILSPL